MNIDRWDEWWIVIGMRVMMNSDSDEDDHDNNSMINNAIKVSSDCIIQSFIQL
jgi:hypothetical protein